MVRQSIDDAHYILSCFAYLFSLVASREEDVFFVVYTMILIVLDPDI